MALDRVGDRVSFAADQDTPAFPQRLIDLVNLEGDLSASEGLHEPGGRRRAKDDVIVEHPKIHGDRYGPSRLVEHHSSHATRPDQSRAGFAVEAV
jgi:hypothetical protein